MSVIRKSLANFDKSKARTGLRKGLDIYQAVSPYAKSIARGFSSNLSDETNRKIEKGINIVDSIANFANAISA